MISGDEDFTHRTLRQWEVEHQRKQQQKKRKNKSKNKRGRKKKKKATTKAKNKSTGMDIMNKNEKGHLGKPKRRSTRGSRVGLEPGSAVIWSGRDGAIFVGTALPTGHAREAGTIWVGRGSGRYYKRELIRISRRCACGPGEFSYFHSVTGDVFVHKPRAVLLLTRTAAALDLSLPADVLRHLCSFFRCPGLLPESLAARAARSAMQAVNHAARVSAAADAACVDEAAAQALIGLAARARRN
jgi:hypothetical protein